MTIEIALALLSGAVTLMAAAIPVTAFILKGRNGNGRYVTAREFDQFRADLGDNLTQLRITVAELEKYIKTHL